MADLQVQHTLRQLYRILEAGEKGFATTAVNMPDPGLKVLMRNYAAQRAKMKEDIMAELARQGGDIRPRSSIPGMIHRGRLAIFAGMSTDKTGQKKTVLKEAALGEGVAVRTYERVLAADLPAGTRALVQQQFDQVRAARDSVLRMRGEGGRQVITKLFDSDREAEVAVQALKTAGLPVEVEKINLQAAEQYQGRGATMLETIISGAFGGALWGSLTGLLAGFGVMRTTNLDGFSPLGLWILAVLGFLLVGALIGGTLAAFIGAHIAEDDTYLTRGIQERRAVLLQVTAESSRADEIAHILGVDRPQAAQYAFKTV